MQTVATDENDPAASIASNDSSVIPTEPDDVGRKGMTLALGVFLLAGIPSLIYQVVWQRLLTLYFGVDIYSTAIAVTVFMLGLGIGSLIGGKVGDRVGAVSRFYAIVEILIGACGAASLLILPMVGERFAGSHLIAVIIINSLLLLVPTILMGMTLPLMCCAVVTTNASIGPRLAALYGINTLGAASGALLTAYLLIGHWGLSGATWIAATLNFLLGIAVILFVPTVRRTRLTVSPREERERECSDDFGDNRSKGDLNHDQDSQRKPPANELSYGTVLACSFLSGFIALGYEIAWYRVSTVLMHGTVYVFGTVLFVFLVSVAVGSLASQKTIGRQGWAKRFAWSQLGIAAYAFLFFSVLGHLSHLGGVRHVISASFFTPFHPSLDLVTGHFNLNAVYSGLDIPFWTISMMAIPATLMGYGFPNLMREGSRRVNDLGTSLSGILFANILGSSLGGLATGFLLIHFFGTGLTIKLLIVLGSAMSLFVFRAIRNGNPRKAEHARGWNAEIGFLVTSTLIAITVFLFPAKHQLIKALHLGDFSCVELNIAENRSGVVALRKQTETIAFKEEKKILNETMLYIDGSRHGSIGNEHDEEIELNVALAAKEGPLRILSIGLGDSIMVSTLAADPRVSELVVVELNSLLPEMTRDTERGRVIQANSEKVNIIVDDGRRWLHANPDETFDMVMMWPLHAAQAYSGNIFSAEFFKLVKEHLNEDGCLFFRSSDPFSTARTVATVFASSIRINTNGYLASDRMIRINPSLTQWNRKQITGMITADKHLILEHTIDAAINTDNRPNSEYYITYPYAEHMRSAIAPYHADPGDMAEYVK